MRRTLVLAALAVAALAPILPTAPASACNPQRPPFCENTTCGILEHVLSDIVGHDPVLNRCGA